MAYRFFAGALSVLVLGVAAPAPRIVCAPQLPGTLVLVGGGTNRPAFMDRFKQIAGAHGKIVLIPSALDDATLTAERLQRIVATTHRQFGASSVVLHTRDRNVADSAAFVAPLRDATGVWILGGDETLLAKTYAGTRTATEIAGVLSRGGVVGGTSAGAMIAGSVLVTFQPSPLKITGAQNAFNLWPNTYIVPHWSQRKFNADLLAAAFKADPSRAAVGIDEATAAIIQDGKLEAVGDGDVAVYDGNEHGAKPYLLLTPGQSISLPGCA